MAFAWIIPLLLFPCISQLLISNSYLGLSKGESDTISVSLTYYPSSSVTVSLSESSSLISLSPLSLTFSSSDYLTPQTFTVSVISVPAARSNIYSTVTISLSVSSSDVNYSNLQYYTTVDIINICTPGSYDWTNTNTCSSSITNFVYSSGSIAPCKTGYYYNSGSCSICETGKYCYDGKKNRSCPAGYYSSSQGAIYCSKIPEGYYYDASSLSPVSTGYFTIPGKSTQTQCLLGDYCPNTNLHNELKCSLGTYSIGGKEICASCPEGSYCTYNYTASCPSNTCSPSGRPDCISGSYSLACSGSTISPAYEGYYILSNSFTACPSNKICSVRFNYSPTSCPLWTYYDSSTGGCTMCSGLQSCLNGQKTDCLSTYIISWGLLCLSCPYPQFYKSGSCYQVSAGQSANTDDCGVNRYSPLGYPRCYFCSPGYGCYGTTNAIPNTNFGPANTIYRPFDTTINSCPQGTYNDIAGNTDFRSCKICPGGFLCNGVGAKPAAGVCTNDSGSNIKCQKCDLGNFCPEGSQIGWIFQCPEGTYSSALSYNAVWAHCSACSLGNACPIQSTTNSNTSPGCYSNDLKTFTYCPHGTFTSGGITSKGACQTCYNNVLCYEGSYTPIPCLLGYINKNSLGRCEPCSTPGYVCPASSWWSSQISCAAGYWCPAGSYSSYQYPCQSGMYSLAGKSAQDDCAECPSTVYCPASSSTSTGTSCSAGFYCPQGTPMSNYFACPQGAYSSNTNNAQSSSCSQCIAGSACFTGSSSPIACATGNFCPSGTERPDQYACPAGTYTSSTSLVSASQCTACGQGYYCPSGSSKQFSCPPGTYLNLGSSTTISNCIACPAGKYCPNLNTITPTDCGVGFYCNSGATAQLKCLKGYYCDSINLTYNTMISNSCPAGYLCPSQLSTNPSGNAVYLCIAGYYCITAAFLPYPCIPGTYRSTTGGTQLFDCSPATAGTYIGTFASTSSTTPCPAGYYCPSSTAIPIPCPAGTYQQSASQTDYSSCIICPAGKFCRLIATIAPTDCPAGSYCVLGSLVPVKCPIGTYGSAPNLQKVADCIQCDAGKYCNVPGLTNYVGNCAAGFLCTGGSITPNPVGQTYGDICPSGSYCPAGTATAQACPLGTFNNYPGGKSSADCIACPSGFYCASTTSATPTGPCDAGYYCTGSATTARQNAAQAGYYTTVGSPNQIPCAIGTYQDQTGQPSCNPCTAGYYCPNTNMAAPLDCPTGFYCPLGTIGPFPCPPGTYRNTKNAQASSDCIPCTAGSYCALYGLSAVSGLCASGFFCEIGSPYQYPATLVDTGNTKYGPCYKGYWCGAGTTIRTQNPCPAGTFNPSEGGKSSSDCLPCSARRYCAGTNNMDDNNLCPANYYCPESSVSGTDHLCTAGHYCPGETANQILCMPGYYQDLAGQSSCKNCPIGYYCPRGTSDYSLNPCPSGAYCLINTPFSYINRCQPGTFNINTQQTSSSSCTSCTAGYYCPYYGVGSLSSLECSAGFYCSGGATVSKPWSGSLYGGICVKGQYCPLGSSSATSCDGGYYCSKDQLSDKSGQCMAGYYCSGGSLVPSPKTPAFSNGDICPKGNYCPQGSSAPIPCNQGYYLPYTGASLASECIICPAGYYCSTSGIDFPTTLCTAGYYCPGGDINPTLICSLGHQCPTGSSEEIPCPDGYFQDSTGQASCKPCTAGNYCELGTTQETLCPKGYFCPALTGYRYTNPCSVGYYNDIQGKSSSSDCKSCTPGYYCELPGLETPSGSCLGGWYCSGNSVNDRPISSSLGGICLPGTYCPTGSTAPLSCTPGSYCNQQGLASPAGYCSIGFYCTSGSKTWVPIDGIMGNICGQGKYCDIGASAEIKCPSGTFSPSKGLGPITDCFSCPYGYFCGSTGLIAPTSVCDSNYYCGAGESVSNPNLCTSGYYCPSNSFEPIPCDMGTYQLNTGEPSCLACPAGKYCLGNVNSPQDCPIGHHCPSSTRFDIEFPCESGTYASTTGLSTCVDCPIGSYCYPGSTTSSNQCWYYSYCPIKTEIPIICPVGYYNSNTYGLTSSSQCTPCPSGYYCVDGRITGQCEAGYLCVLASPTPTPSGSNAYGYPCPTGNYCPKGTLLPVPCPSGLFRRITGGKRQEDCTQCPPGSYCVSSNPEPVSCPMGYFCPQGVSKPISCPSRTYGSKAGGTDQSVCLACPGGYLCNRSGIGDYTAFPCNKVGYYCVLGATAPTPCPPGTYSSSLTAASIDDCKLCPGGNQCPGASNDVLPCRAGTYCPKGSPVEKACSIGYYCHVNTTTPVLCPLGYYCPKYDQSNLTQYQDSNEPPIPCPSAYICPLGSFTPLRCNPGYYANNNNCVECSSGTYSDGTYTKCKNCYGGYICSSAASRPNPVFLKYHGGYACPVGYYCPSGSKSPTACPIATYNPSTSQTSQDSCLPCPSNTYSDTTGSSKCLPCGTSAYSNEGSTTCTCKGANRSYQKSDGRCICIPSYEFLQDGIYSSNEDSSADCFPMVYSHCDQTQIRNPDGSCSMKSDCSSECNGKSGTRMSNGICECDEVKTSDGICNKNCRENAPSVIMIGNVASIYDPTSKTFTNVSLGNSNGYYGKTKCSTKNCTVYSVDMTENGPQGVYGIGNALSSNSSSSRRLLSQSTAVDNPVFCISIGDTFLFSIANTKNYPVYSKDSLLNTNPNFDYGAFTELKRMIKNPQNSISSFAFTFSSAGVYDFIDADDSSKHIIVTVMGSGQKCLNPTIPLRSATKSSILTSGVTSNRNIIKDPDWQLIITTCSWLIAIVIGVLFGLYFYHNKAWNYFRRNIKSYRENSKNMDLIEITEKEQIDIEIDDEETALDKTQIEIKVTKKDKHKKIKEDIDESTLANDDIDPSIFQAMYDRLLEQEQIQKINFVKKNEDAKQATNQIINKLAKLKKCLKVSLGGLSELKDFEDEIVVKLTPQQEMEKVMHGLVGKYLKDVDYKTGAGKDSLYENIVNNHELLQKDKQNLIRDFNANIQRIEDALETENSKAQEILKNRLIERVEKRNKSKEFKYAQLTDYEIEANNVYLKQNPDLKQEFEEKKQEILNNLEKELNTQAIQLRENLEKELKTVRYKAETGELIAEYEESIKKLENGMEENKSLQINKLAALLRSRKDKNYYIDFEEPNSIRNGKKSVIIPSYFKEKDEAMLENLEQKQEIELKEFHISQEKEIEEELKIYEKELEDTEKNIKLATDSIEIDILSETKSLEKENTPESRSMLKAIKKAEIMKKADERKEEFLEKQEREINKLRDEVAIARFEELMKRQMRPADIASRIKDMLDEKHETDLAILAAKKHALLTEKQTILLQEMIAQKAVEIVDVHKNFNRKREKIENSNLPTETKMSEYFILDRKETDALSAIDYNFINKLNKEQDNLWREIEGEYRKKLLDLSDKHFQDIVNILKRMRSANPELLEFHIKQAQEDSDIFKSQIQKEYNSKLKEIEKREQELVELQEERQQEIVELQRELDEAEAKKNEMVEMEKMRKEMENRQKEMLEEMKNRGIGKEKMEEIIKQHQQEICDWEGTMEAERHRQRELMLKKIAKKVEENQKKMKGRKIAKYHEENEKLATKKEDEPLKIKFPTEKPMKLYEPIKDVITHLKGTPLIPHQRAHIIEYADHSVVLQKLLTRVKNLEKIAENIDAAKFSTMMKSMRQVSKLIDNAHYKNNH